MSARTKLQEDGEEAGKTLQLDTEGVDLYAVFCWALPVSALVAASLSVLSYTLSPVAGPFETKLYLAFFSAALVGFLSAALVGRAGRKISRAVVLADALVLEAAFAFFMLGYPLTQPPSAFTWAGVLMTGYAAASLLALWLGYQPSDTPRAALLGVAIAFFCGFLIRLVQSTLPPLMIGFLFPWIAAVPLVVEQRRRPRPREPRGFGLSGRPLGLTLPSAARFVLAGFGMGLMGSGSYNADYSAGLLALLAIAAAFYRRREALAVVSSVASAFMVAGLCLWLLPRTGAPFAIYLAGCGSLVVCLLCQARGDAALSRLLLGAATVLCLAGLGLQQALAQIFAFDARLLVLVLIMALALVDALCRILESPQRPVPAAAGSGAGPAEEQVPAPDAAVGPRPSLEAFAAYRLSAREAEVADYLLENKSVGFICASLGLSQSTVKTHIRHIYRKLDIHSKDELQLLAQGSLKRTSP